MSPTKFYDDHQQARSIREINGSRPSPLKINKDSHLIHKPSSSSTSSTSSSLTGFTAAATKHHHQQQQLQLHHPPPHQQRHPVIIYTHSPKIIHTKARDFMALVQKLTGFSPSDNNNNQEVQPHQSLKTAASTQVLASEQNNNNHNDLKGVYHHGHDDTTSSSVITDENCGGVTDVQVSSNSISPVFDPMNPYFFDIPLFTPNATDFFCPSRPIYRYPDHQVFSSSNMGSSISPSVLEVMKGGFQEY